MRRATRLLTPANVLAGLALFFALGGTGWAGQVLGKSSVGSVQLKSNAVTSSKIANGAVTAKKLAAGVVGGVTASKITKVDSPIAAIPANSTGTPVTATCAAGAKAVGGGWSAGLYAQPAVRGADARRRRLDGFVPTGSQPASVSVSVMCIAA